MSARNQTLKLMQDNSVVRKRMYKTKHHWAVAAMGTVAMGAGTVGLGLIGSPVHADTVSPAQTAGTATVQAPATVTPTATVGTTTTSTNNPTMAPSSTPNLGMVSPSTIAGMQTTSQLAPSSTPAPTPVHQTAIKPAEGSSTIQGPQTWNSVTPLTPSVNSANVNVASAFTSQHNTFEDAGATLDQGSTMRISAGSDNLSSAAQTLSKDQNSQLANISVAASTNASLHSMADKAQSIADILKGSVTVLSALDVSSMNTDEIASAIHRQDKFMKETMSDNAILEHEIDLNRPSLQKNGGDFVPGSAIDTTNMSRVDVRSMMASQRDMIDATGSAAEDIMSTVDLWSEDISDFGGKLTHGGTINTADNMTSMQVAKTVKLQDEHIAGAGIGNDIISNMVDMDAQSIIDAGGVYKAGPMIDVTKMSTKEIKSLIKQQVAMLKAVVKADRQVGSLSVKYKDDIVNNGGSLGLNVVNAADNMTPDKIVQNQSANASQVSLVASADVQMPKLYQSAREAIHQAGGVLKKGSLIDASSMTPEDLASLIAVQSATIDATVKADQAITSAVKAAGDKISDAGGSLMRGATINTADNMDASAITSQVAKDTEHISVAVSGDVVIKSMLDEARPAIEKLHGHLTTGSDIDVTNMNSDDIADLMESQSTMLSATLSADTSVLKDVTTYSQAYMNAGGHLTEGSIVNTADNMNLSDIGSIVRSNHILISAGGSANTEVASLKNLANSLFAQTGGQMVLGSAIDASSMTARDIQDAETSQAAMLSATIVADTEMSNAVAKNTEGITKIGGTVQQSGVINTADQMTMDDVTSQADSMAHQLELVNSADIKIAQVRDQASAALAKVNGLLKPGSGVVDVTTWDQATIDSFVDQQSAILSVTASANDLMASIEAQYSQGISQAGGSMTAAGMINTASNMSQQAVSDTAEHEAENMTGVGVDDTKLAAAQSSANVASKPFGGQVITGAPKDMTSAELNDIHDLFNSQSDMIANVASGNIALSNAAKANSTVVASLGGVMKPGAVQDVTTLGADALSSLLNSQVAQISAVGAADTSLADMVQQVTGLVTNASGTITRLSAINVSSQDPEQIAQLVTDQVNNLQAVGRADGDLVNALKTNSGVVTQFGGQLVIGSAVDATHMNMGEIQSAVASQVARVSAAGNQTTSLQNALSTALASVTPMGGTLTKGAVLDVSSMTPAEIAAKIQTEIGILQATANGDTALSQAVQKAMSNVAQVKGQISKGDLVETAALAADQISNEVAKQVNNLTQIAQADAQINDAFVAAKPKIEAAGGTIAYVNPVSGERMTSDAIQTYALAQVNPVSAVAANDQVLIDAVHQNQSAFTHNGGSLVQGSVTDVTSETVGNINTAVTNQTSHMAVILNGVNILNSNIDKYGSDIVQGSAEDFTERNSADVSSFVGSQGTAMGRANDINGAVDKYVSDLSRYHVSATVETKTVSTQEELEKIAQDNSNKNHEATDGGVESGSASVTFTKVKYQYHGLKMTYHPLGINVTGLSGTVHGLTNHGTATPLKVVVNPYSTSYHPYEDNGGFAPLLYKTTPMSMTYRNFESDGSGINVVGDNGDINPGFTGYAPLSVTYKTFDSDASTVPDGDTFTGLAPFDVVYNAFESDGEKVPADDNFTGVSPLTTSYAVYESDGTKVPAGHRFTGLAPYGTKLNVYSLDGTAVPKGDKFTGIAPLGLQWFGYTSDGSKVKAGHNFTGVSAFNTSYQPLSTHYHFYRDVPTVNPGQTYGPIDGGQAHNDSYTLGPIDSTKSDDQNNNHIANQTESDDQTKLAASDQTQNQDQTKTGTQAKTDSQHQVANQSERKNQTDQTMNKSSQLPKVSQLPGQAQASDYSVARGVKMMPLASDDDNVVTTSVPSMEAVGTNGVASAVMPAASELASAMTSDTSDAGQASLPQTGNEQNSAALLGLAMLAMTLSTGLAVKAKARN